MFLLIKLTLLSLAFLPANMHRGQELFTGQASLRAKIRGHDDFLPPEAVRCLNCHDAPNPSRLSRTAAPHINRSLLLDSRPRRGGPPSRYDQPAFCRMLRTGADPAYILIAREMPVYELDDAQCASLWTYLISKDDIDAKH